MSIATKIKPISQTEARRILDQQPTAPAGLLYYVIGPNCWGRDKSALKATNVARGIGGKGVYTLHLVNDYAEVDGVDGTLRFNSSTEGKRLSIMVFRA